MIYEHKSYRSFLKSILVERKAKNPSYSLRAMARDVGLLPSHLSAIHSGTKSLSLNSALKIAKTLGLDARETEYFCLLVQFDGAKEPELKDSFSQRLREINKSSEVTDLNVDLFKMISDWYHIPILEMTNMADFEFTPKNIATRLGITPLEAEVAIERLMRLELLERDEKGRFQKAVNNYLFKSKKSNQALRNFHEQMIEKAAESLQTQGPEERYNCSQTFVIDPAQLAEAQKVIDECCQKLVKLFDQGRHRSETYHFGAQLFNLTNGGNKK